MQKMDTSGIEPEAFRLQSGRDTTTLRKANMRPFSELPISEL